MGFERDLLSTRVAAEDRVVRVVVAAVRGSAPREVGAAMILGPAGQTGTIGGGALEYEAAARAKVQRAPELVWSALGPELGQCCGGSVALFYEPLDAEGLAGLSGDIILRPVAPAPKGAAAPLALRRMVAQARNGAAGEAMSARLVDGWFLEPVQRAGRDVWIWGAGHVGRALVAALAPLPELAITWVDTDPARFPAQIPDGVTCLPAADPARLTAHAPIQAEHLVMTYSHALDLAICDGVLGRGFGFCGVIGSATKWARFSRRLRDAGHPDAQISRIQCPIGDKALGKHPQAIALGVATRILERGAQTAARKDRIA